MCVCVGGGGGGGYGGGEMGYTFTSLPFSVSQSSGAVVIRGGRPGLPVLMSLTVSVDVKQH